MSTSDNRDGQRQNGATRQFGKIRFPAVAAAAAQKPPAKTIPRHKEIPAILRKANFES